MTGTGSTAEFDLVWGRGYRPGQVDRAVAELTEAGRAARRRAEELDAAVRESAERLERLREHAAGLPPQRYEDLGARAQRIWALAEEEDETLRADALAEARRLAEEAASEAARTGEAARAAAEAVRADAEASADKTLGAARESAEAERAAAREEAERVRAEGAAVLRAVRERGERLFAEQRQKHGELREAVEREDAAAEAALVADHDRLLDATGERLGAAERVLAEAAEQARHTDEDASARAQELLGQARLRAERVERETERLLREHEAAAEEMRAHMAHVRSSLAALTGRGTEE
ncbi:cellulose-binding protein [Streptomyces sp. NPDC046887]|uniref:cellulose-binding protein n=1 Tax=Streptomyces sp. NPDC046887 TaxID=3155472 RepID=UPI0033C953FA